MTHTLELAIREIRGAVPGIWMLAQILAAVAALAYVALRTRPRSKMVLSMAMSLPAGALGALLLGSLYRVLDRFAGGDGDLVGVAAYGALLGVCVAFTAVVRRQGLPVLPSLDAIAPALALLVGVGRLGCLFAGCDAGHVSASVLAVRFTAGTSVFREHVAQRLVLPSDPWSLAVHPTQLYEASFALALAWFGDWLRKRDRLPPGFGFGAVALGYAVLRTIVDALRLPGTSSLYGMVTSLLVGLGVILLLRQPPPASRSTTT